MFTDESHFRLSHNDGRVRVYRIANQNATQFQHDNARPHVARIVTQYLQQHDVHVLPWPAFSPDLSPIEHAWNELDRRVRQRPAQAHNVQELAEALAEEWHTIPQRTFQRLVGSMRRRILACIAARGGYTRY